MFKLTSATTLFVFSVTVVFANCLSSQHGKAEIIEITGFQPPSETQEHIVAEVVEVQSADPPQHGWGHGSTSTEIYSPQSFTVPAAEVIFEYESPHHAATYQETNHHGHVIQTTDAAGVSDTSELLEMAGVSSLSELPDQIFSKDVGYKGPGDMRTHLWRDHSSDLEENGISQESLMAMPMESVQKWHNYFHGTAGAPDDHESESELDHSVDADTVAEPATMAQPSPVSP